MFVHMKRLPAKTADAFDLALEFSTLGEYGLEYPEVDPPSGTRRCEERDRLRPATGDGRERRQSNRACSTETSDFASALKPPRIRLSFTD
jgi:hypothetical protein